MQDLSIPLIAVLVPPSPCSLAPLQLAFVPRLSFVELLPAGAILVAQAQAKPQKLECMMRHRSMAPPIHPYRRFVPAKIEAAATVAVARPRSC